MRQLPTKLLLPALAALALGACGGGDPQAGCPTGLTDCAGSCRDVANDRANCGGCGIACPANSFCVAGHCSSVCPFGFAQCGAGCRDLQADRAHCGACGNACASGLVCAGGQCAPTCGATLTSCNGTCTNTLFDPAHCGGCGGACPTPANARPACASGACGFLCLPSHRDCDHDPENGCEADVSADPDNCGACGNACAAQPNAAPACAENECGLGACDTDYADCDEDPANGCEIDTATTAAHCGACGNSCAANEVCQQGQCTNQPTTLIPGNTALVVERAGVEATCTEWVGPLCTQPKLRPVAISCATYAHANLWHAIHFDGNFFCFYATGDRTVVSTGSATFQGPPTVHGHWSTNTCASDAATLPHGYPSGALSSGTSLAWDWARGAIGSIAVTCNW